MKEQLKLENQLCFRMYTASRLIIQAYHPLLSKLGITYSQYLVFLVLWEKDKQLVNEITRKLYLETSTVTPVLQRMEMSGFITREKDPRDARRVIVKLTSKGKKLEEKATNIPLRIANAIDCRSINDDSTLDLFNTLDDVIGTLSKAGQ